jgi:hypothetical protein
MQVRTRAHIGQLLLLVGMPVGLQAGFIKIWQLKETATAPLLVVGRVLAVQKTERVPDASLPWKTETWVMTAEIQVLRSYTGSGKAITADRLQVHFLAYGGSSTVSVNGNPPPLPRFEPGKVMVLPLQDQSPGLWRLMADSGADLTIPARAEITNSGPLPTSARAFLDREIANALGLGTSREVSDVALYLAGQYEDLTGELMPLLESLIGADRERWAEVATNALAPLGIPRPGVADLLSKKVESTDRPGRPSLLLAQAALQKLSVSPETDTLLIKTWIAEAPLHAWGSANALLEFGDNPITTENLRQALRNDLAGSSYIAWTLAEGGHRGTLAEARARAIRVADRPDATYEDLQGAAGLLRDFGTDQELKQLAALVGKYQTGDRNFYYSLWQFATGSGKPREARVIAVVLRDRRIVSGKTRYCDIGVYLLEKAVGEQFSLGAKTIDERDDAVARAVAWVESHGLSN